MSKAISIALTVLAVACMSLLSSCSSSGQRSTVDRLNETAYQWRYRDLDSTRALATQAYAASRVYDGGRAEALNTLAFVYIAKMQYEKATSTLNEIAETTDNQIELLIADIQHMRLCQRQSENKDFYTYLQSATHRLNRIRHERSQLNKHQLKRLVYAESEYGIVASTYFYYVGLRQQSIAAIKEIEPSEAIVADTAQLLNYYYNIGAGGIVEGRGPKEIRQKEFDFLIRCYLLSRQYRYPYWEANSLQSLSEHLQDAQARRALAADNRQEMDFINADHMPDSLLAGNLAQRALTLFAKYGDVYQTAGAFRTLSECYWSIGDYRSALICLTNALEKDTAIAQAPDLVASIREQLSLVYSAMDDKKNSDYNRNVYLDMQEVTRQDRELEARAEQLDKSSHVLSLMIGGVVVMIGIVTGLLYFFGYLRRKGDSGLTASTMLAPLRQWESDFEEKEREKQARLDELEEEAAILSQKVLASRRRYIEQQAKVSLILSIVPLINRMKHEADKLLVKEKDTTTRESRYQYMKELAEKINDYNTVLTRWIQMRKGQLSLHIESFPIQDIFDIIAKGSTEYRLQGISLHVEKTDAVVKADKVLTLFMVNTIAENAKRYTPSGGRIDIQATVHADRVEIAISDTGIGIPKEKMPTLFDHKLHTEGDPSDHDAHGGSGTRVHGFGLMNCKGIIEKYRKISSIFSVCQIGAESTPGKGSRFSFCLPKGIVRTLLIVCTALSVPSSAQARTDYNRLRASAYADSAYFSNVKGDYARTLLFADSCRTYLNAQYKKMVPHGTRLMQTEGADPTEAAELEWFRDSIHIDYAVVLDIRNETAVAALALHRWSLYAYNNRVYTQLFRACSTDNTLSDYVSIMQKSENNKNIAIALLLILLFSIFPAYYFLYYRHRVAYRMYVDKIAAVNEVLAADIPITEKLKQITKDWGHLSQAEREIPEITALNDIVRQIHQALKRNIAHQKESDNSITYAEDQLRREQMDADKLHIRNSILDNCLSTLKHETMYYPSRIHQLIDGTDQNLHDIAELISYYRELYTTLCEQATRQTEGSERIDYNDLEYLLEILHRRGGADLSLTEERESPAHYVTLRIPLKELSVTPQQAAQLFTPETTDLHFLICRQIIRNIGNATGARACGIRAVSDADGQTFAIITITKSIWNNSKSSSSKTSLSN